MTPKSSATRQITPVSRDISSEIPVKTSLLSHARCSWLTIVMSLIAVGGILGTIGIPVVSFVILRPTTLSSKLSD
jgi:hypothetical protein